jgi:hypothetical protein
MPGRPLFLKRWDESRNTVQIGLAVGREEEDRRLLLGGRPEVVLTDNLFGANNGGFDENAQGSLDMALGPLETKGVLTDSAPIVGLEADSLSASERKVHIAENDNGNV